ncbi:hypothetical protein [Acinetobacter sp. Ver3]|uniref:hypothetical protein n=1 Tax=Acinetobacter sp. Ver3 TaxID=466088 RepID=UPI00044A1F2A|nr:hypothetical protein [Acinetobacter sp. Ver3]EZQ01416.1 signal peptide protein [Acinetobacter sp. Ver3]
MKNSLVAVLFSVIASMTYALEPMSDEALKNVEGQAGADLSLKLSLNQKLVTENNVQRYVFDDALCKDAEYCRLALAVNNRYIKDGQASSTDGFKLWLVFKGIQGTLNIQKIGLDGVDLSYKNDSGTDQLKAAMQLSFDPSKPIQIRNFGFDALAFGQDKFTSNATTEGVGTSPADYGYLQVTRYDSSNAPRSAYDHGRETGFMGLKMNGNLAVQGKVMMFGCDGSHQRC